MCRETPQKTIRFRISNAFVSFTAKWILLFTIGLDALHYEHPSVPYTIVTVGREAISRPIPYMNFKCDVRRDTIS